MSRSKELVEKRNIAIKERYQHLYNVEKMRNDVIFEMLQNEFYIVKRTLHSILFEKKNNKK